MTERGRAREGNRMKCGGLPGGFHSGGFRGPPES
uniref:Uncharacterized protein n=1 Tax=Anguilla anguilla TaxID=7936 RepID=A0A0E9T5M8_ANGAN